MGTALRIDALMALAVAESADISRVRDASCSLPRAVGRGRGCEQPAGAGGRGKAMSPGRAGPRPLPAHFRDGAAVALKVVNGAA